ncbi:hypothetical protein [Xanthomonas pisi]|uniref:Uncharacterized protein n=1 Tax=Xanthomonas pisi TaxID=56457 RepID=A0A2S7CSV3_9XANT|nr:hypothetical protein [Xanthomonas pisi]PPU64678.1 hypothetical protein XpiCFBP4643_21790 [Xanthomonas pisi]
MQPRLFETKFTDLELVLSDKTILYSRIFALSHFNRRHIQNLVPAYEIFCINIKHDSGQSTLLYCNIKLRQYAGGGGLRTCFKIPAEIEAQITNLRQEYLATLKILSERSGVSPKQKGLLFENAMEILAVFKNAHAAAA